MTRDRLACARLYLCVDAAVAPAHVEAALAGGVDMVQLRDKRASDENVLRAAAPLRELCGEFGALFWVNDRPDLAVAARADGVHVGQEDTSVAAARAQAPGLLVGLSTHSPAELAEGLRAGADELSVGPVWATPTKDGRPGTGLDYVRHAAATAGDRPWFAIGGIDADNVESVLDAGARRIVVVRAIRDVPDPRAAAAALREALDRRWDGL